MGEHSPSASLILITDPKNEQLLLLITYLQKASFLLEIVIDCIDYTLTDILTIPSHDRPQP